MALLFNKLFTDDILRWKAPRNMMYVVKGVNFADNSSNAAVVSVFNRSLEQGVFQSTQTQDAFATFRILAGTATNHFIGPIEVEGKFLSIVKDSGQAVNTRIHIYGDLIKATKLKLLWEWFRAGR